MAVDILRATTAICAAFKAGAQSVLPLDSLEPLAELHSSGYLVAAEREGKKLPLASCGNSPTEYLSMDLSGQRLAYSTTNGTVSILAAAGSKPLLVGSFANITSLQHVITQRVKPDNLVILCSGWRGEPSIEDTLFGGALISRLMTSSPVLVNDAAQMALDLWRVAGGNLYDYCQKATHVKRLQRLGVDDDIRFSFQEDTCSLVPCLDPSSLSLTCI